MPEGNDLIYDVGMNNGDDCEYYLAKGYRVIAIEANPDLCRNATERFEYEIRTNQLTILNVGVGSNSDVLPFWVHKWNSVLSTFVPPGERVGFTGNLKADEFDLTYVTVKRLSDIVRYFGKPEYIKIDVEGYDGIALRDLDSNRISPRYLSAEAHSINIPCILIAMGYNRFKIVHGGSVHIDFVKLPIGLTDGHTSFFDFKPHSAGPFGEDIPGDYMDSEELMKYYCERGGGWYDIHAKFHD